MYKGSCLCGRVRYEINGEPKKASNCHCTMCQKQHGAAFATYVSVPRNTLHYLNKTDELSSYRSSGEITRRFCKTCGSNIEWSGSKKHPDWTSIALATFDTEFIPDKLSEIYIESKVSWYG